MPKWLTELFAKLPGGGQGRLDRIDAKLSLLITQGITIMASTQELLDLATATVEAVNATRDAVAPLPAAVDALEAAVTAALKQIGSIPAADQANIDAAVAELHTAIDAAVQTTAAAAQAAADAADGVDEASQP